MCIRYSCRYLKLSYWLYKTHTEYQQTHQWNEYIINSLCDSIEACGSVCIKFTQWITPILELTYVEENDLFSKDRIKPLWLTKLERFYEDCHIHETEYTKQVYRSTFDSELEDDYEIIDIIASGSIGQVYKLKKDDELYALKVIHPQISYEIRFIRRFLQFIFWCRCTRKIVTNILPFNLLQFVDDFEKQCDLINESNNLLQFHHRYKDNEFIVIPEIYKISKNMLLMSYEDGTQLCKSDISEYHKYKAVNLLHLFARNNNEVNFCHGDLHNGNWKLRPYKKNYQVVIYDFGYCWKMWHSNPKYIIDIFSRSFETPEHKNDINIDEWVIMLNYCISNLEGAISDSVVKDYLLTEIHQINAEMLSPVLLYKITAKFCKLHSILIEPVMIQFIIITIQLSLNLIDHNLQGSSKNPINNEIIYKERYLDMLSFCKTYSIFPDYREVLERKIQQYTKLDSIFGTISMPDSIRELALQ